MSRKHQKGMVLLGAVIGIALMVAAASVALKMQARHSKDQMVESMIEEQARMASQYYRAASEWIEFNQESWSNNSRVVVNTSDLISDGYLPTNFDDQTPFKTRLTVAAYKDNNGITRFIMSESGSVNQQFLEHSDIPTTIPGILRFKQRIAKAYAENNLLGGTHPATQSSAVGLNNRFSKNISSYFSAPGEARSVAFGEFEDLEQYYPSGSGSSSGGSGGDGIGSNAEHGEQSWTTYGTYTWNVPDGVGTVYMEVAGAGGGILINFADTAGNTHGGGIQGGFIAGNMGVLPGGTITIVVGQGGRNTEKNAGCFDYPPYYCGMTGGGGGGGRTAIYSDGTLMLVAGGGGGSTDASSRYGFSSSGGTGGACGAGGGPSTIGRGTAKPGGAGANPNQNGGNGWNGSDPRVSCSPWSSSYCSINYPGGGGGGGAKKTLTAGGGNGGYGGSFGGTKFSPSFGGGGSGGSNAGLSIDPKYRPGHAGGGGGGGYVGGKGGNGGYEMTSAAEETGTGGYGGSGFCMGMPSPTTQTAGGGSRYDGYVRFYW